MSTGFLITLEGIHGCGKTSVSNSLFSWLRSRDLPVVQAVDQSGTALGSKLRKINVEDFTTVDEIVEALLVAAARRQNIVEVIRPGLAAGNIVICERLHDAYFAFQQHARGLSPEFVEIVTTTIAEQIHPDLTLLLDLPAAMSLARLPLPEQHRIERQPVQFHERVRQGYLTLAHEFRDRIKIMDARLPLSAVFEASRSIVEDALILKGYLHHAWI